MNDDSFGKRLQEVADIAGSVAALSRKTSISASTIKGYIEEANDPTRKKIITICQVAGVNIEWLTTGKGPKCPGEEEKISKKETIKEKEQYQQLAKPTDYDNFRISDKITKTVRVLESNTIYRAALAANIDAFDHAVTQEQTVQNQQQRMIEQQNRISSLEVRMASLEKLLSSVSATPGDYKKEENDKAV